MPTACEMARAHMNKVKPPTHKYISEAGLEEIAGKQRISVHPCVRCTCPSREEGPDPFNGCDASFGFPAGLSLKVGPLPLARAGTQSTPDSKDGNVVVAVILRQQGDLCPLPGRQVWVADLEVSGVKLEQSEHFDLYFKGVPKNKHIDLL